jgi:hypothetical protein
MRTTTQRAEIERSSTNWYTRMQTATQPPASWLGSLAGRGPYRSGT